MKINEIGRSMIEMLGVLGVMGVLSVGGFELVHKANNSRKTNAVIDEVSSLAMKSRTVIRDYEAPSSEGGESVTLTNVSDYVHTGRGYPDTLQYNEGKYFESAQEVEYKLYYSSSDNVLFILEAKGLTNNMCMQMAMMEWGSKSSNGFLGLSIGGTPDSLNGLINGSGSGGYYGIPGNQEHPVPMGVGTASVACGDNVTMYFAFR